MMRIKDYIVGLAMLVLAGCASVSGGDGKVPLGPIGQQVADAVIDVSDENRGLRICWLAAGAVEVMTDLAQRGGDVQKTLGHLVLLQGAIDTARATDPHWRETDGADVALLFASVLKDVGKSRLAQILLGGPTVSNFLNVAKRTVIISVKGAAVMRDMNRVLQDVEDGVTTQADAWKACEGRTAANRNTLYLLSGVPVAGGHGNRMRARNSDFIIDDSILAWPFDFLQNGDGNPGFLDGGSILLAEGWRDWVVGHTLSSTETFAPTLMEGWLDGTRLSSTSFFGVAPNRMAEYAIIRPAGRSDFGATERGGISGTKPWDFIWPPVLMGGGMHDMDGGGWGSIDGGSDEIWPPGGSVLGTQTVELDFVWPFADIGQGGDHGAILGGGSGGIDPKDGDAYPDGWVVAGVKSGIDDWSLISGDAIGLYWPPGLAPGDGAGEFVGWPGGSTEIAEYDIITPDGVGFWGRQSALAWIPLIVGVERVV